MDVRSRITAAAGIALCAIAVGGATRYIAAAPHAGTRGTPAPEFHSRIESVSHAEVMRYVGHLTFDTSYHAIDSRRLIEHRDGKLVEGAFAVIAPEAGSTQISWSQLDSGRIMARVTVDAAMPSRGYAKGDNYIWVENRNGHLHGVVIPADSTVQPTVFPMAIVHKYVGPARAPEARFRWSAKMDEPIWFACAAGCCTADGPDGGHGVVPGSMPTMPGMPPIIPHPGH